MTFASFMDLAEAVRERIDAGDRDSALALLSGTEKALPLHAGHIYAWRAALLTEVGRVEDALDVLDDALAAGCRYRAEWLREDRRLSPLLGRARFEDLVERAASRYVQDQAVSRPSLEVLTPGVPKPASGYPTLIALHGNSSNVTQTLPYWKSACELGWLVALPQSGEIGTSPGAYTWNSRDRTQAELERHREELRARSLMDERALVLAGFSMGALQALALVLTRRVSASGVLSVGAYLPHIREFRVLVESGNAAGVQFCIVVGAKDASGYEGAKQLAAELERAGVDVLLDARSDLGHAYPPDMDATLLRALAFMGDSASVKR
ncbi:MAG: alpha/beta hydrolase [Candidatus Limnocylindria bacterium]